LLSKNPEKSLILEEMTEAYVESGILVNSAQFDGMESIASQKAITDWMTQQRTGKHTVTYRVKGLGNFPSKILGNSNTNCLL